MGSQGLPSPAPTSWSGLLHTVVRVMRHMIDLSSIYLHKYIGYRSGSDSPD